MNEEINKEIEKEDEDVKIYYGADVEVVTRISVNEYNKIADYCYNNNISIEAYIRQCIVDSYDIVTKGVNNENI